MLTFPISTLSPAEAAKIGFFGIPGDDASKAGATMWLPGGQYIPKTSKNIDAAKKFVAFVASVPGTEASRPRSRRPAPTWSWARSCPTTRRRWPKDMQAYIDAKTSTPALEFVSPVKGPSLEQIMVAVMTGQTSAQDGAAQYDADVTKQAKQLGLPGW